jgi:hypothetical protein
MRIHTTKVGTGRRSWANKFAAALSLSLLSGLALCDVQQIVGTPTTLNSTAERMISYRCQSHSWQTADGATHVMINRGPGPSGDSLMLYSTFDGGATWVSSEVTLPGSNGSTTADGYLEGNRLHMTYDVGTGRIQYAELNYDPDSRTWVLGVRNTVYDSNMAVALTPALAVDALGRQWLTFTNQDKGTGNYSIKLMRRAVTDQTWHDTGFVFGDVDNNSNERSGRPIATSRGIGVVFTVHADTYWAERRNTWPLDAQWPQALISTKAGRMNDPYGTHFSIVADSKFNMHLLSVDAGQVIYSRYLVAENKWTTRTLTQKIRATYLQATMVEDKLTVVTNNYTNLSVYQSNDGGDTFARTHDLTHDAPTGQISYDRPRVETPAYSTNPIPVLQQYADGKIQHALFFSVTAATGNAAVQSPQR